MKSIGHEGLNNLLVAYEDKSAKAVCTFGFSKGPGHEPILFQGITEVIRAFFQYIPLINRPPGQGRAGKRPGQVWMGPHL